LSSWIFEFLRILAYEILLIGQQALSGLCCLFMFLLCLTIECLCLRCAGLNLGDEAFKCIQPVVGCSFFPFFFTKIDTFAPKIPNFDKLKNNLIRAKPTQVQW
jgi:hypothetical protein